jgi:hypothetical protein
VNNEQARTGHKMVRSAFNNEGTRESNRASFEGLDTVLLVVTHLRDIGEQARGIRGTLTWHCEKFVVYNA